MGRPNAAKPVVSKVEGNQGMTPVNLNEFLLRHPAILKLRLQVDEAAVAVKYAHVASLRALTDKNAPLIARWSQYFRECNHGHQIFMGAFYDEMTALFSLRTGKPRPIDRTMLVRKLELDDCMVTLGKAEEVCDRSFHDKNTALFLRWQEHFENCRVRYLVLLSAFRREFLGSRPM
jgi:hypothetical protein